MKYRLGLDLGTNSIGWCMLRLNNDNEPVAIIKMGSRIFHDGRNEKDKQPLAVKRREARGMRRNLDRRKARIYKLLHHLINAGMLPDNEEDRKKLVVTNPYEIRSKAVNEEVSLCNIGRALMHIAKRRGFKSNRKADKVEDSGRIKPAIKRFKETLEQNQAKTAGEYLYKLMLNGKNVRARLSQIDGKKDYELYMDRNMMEDEYYKIMDFQKQFHKEINDELIKEFHDIIFFQRELKPQQVGKCAVFRDEIRLFKAHPIAQEFIMLQKLNDLRIYDNSITEYRMLTDNEKNIIKKELRKKKQISFESLRKILKKFFPHTEYGGFNLEVSSKEMQGNITNAVMSGKLMFGDKWNDMAKEKQWEIIEKLYSDDVKNDEFIVYLAQEFALGKDNIDNIMDLAMGKLPLGYLNYGKTAAKTLAEIMDKENIDLHNAKEQAGYHHGESLQAMSTLPYYGEVLQESVVDTKIDNPRNDEEKYGKIANPTVHIAMNQLRKLINEIIALYGKPDEIVIELARDLKNSKKDKDEIRKANLENKKLNEKVDALIDEIVKTSFISIPKNKDNRDKVKLWLEMGGVNCECVYTGDKISQDRLFSDEVQIEHILPFSRTLDNSLSNKTLSVRRANYYKSNRTPYEAFGKSQDGFDYEDILERAKKLPQKKSDRFLKDAMDKFNNENGDFIARQLTDTQYISRLALKYIRVLYDENEHSRVWTTPGKLTAMIRSKLGLNSIISTDGTKNRDDHRHHAIDAFVIAVTTRSFLQKIAGAADDMDVENNKNKYSKRNKLLKDMPRPYAGYLKNIKQCVENIKVSHKSDRGIEGQLHEDTAYGLIKHDKSDKYNVVTRWSPDKFKEKKHFEAIRDKELKDIACNNKDKFMELINERHIRGIRILKSENPVISVKNKAGDVYKVFAGGNNLCLEVYMLPDGKKGFEVIQLFDANQKVFRPKWMTEYPEAKLLMRLFKGDIIGYLENRKYKYFVVKGIRISSKNFILLPINISDENCKINKSFSILFNDLNAKQFNISMTGRVSKMGYANTDFWYKLKK